MPKTVTKINPVAVRYIKLGEGGRWEQECVGEGIIRFGFWTGQASLFKLCLSGSWKEVREYHLNAKRTKGNSTRATNETKVFFEDPGDTLWITYIGERLYWGMLIPGAPLKHSSGDGTYRKVLGGWRHADIKGKPLTRDRLSGALNKLSMYRGTSCKVDVKNYAIRRINGQRSKEVERAELARTSLRDSIPGLLKLLVDRDFETLVDLFFQPADGGASDQSEAPKRHSIWTCFFRAPESVHWFK